MAKSILDKAGIGIDDAHFEIVGCRDIFNHPSFSHNYQVALSHGEMAAVEIKIHLTADAQGVSQVVFKPACAHAFKSVCQYYFIKYRFICHVAKLVNLSQSPKVLVNTSEERSHFPFSFTYTSVTIKGKRTALPPTSELRCITL